MKNIIIMQKKFNMKSKNKMNMFTKTLMKTQGRLNRTFKFRKLMRGEKQLREGKQW